MQWQQPFGKKEEIQEKRYVFPYHYLAHEVEQAWLIGRYEIEGFQYLSRLEAVIAYVHRLNPARLLDFGCGDGRLLYELAQRRTEAMIGVDISQRALWHARAACTPYPHVQLFHDLQDMPPDPFEMIVAMEVIEHIPPEMLPGLMGKLRDSLVDNGRFLITVPSTNLPVSSKHYQHFDPDSLRSALHGHFEIETIDYVHKISVLEQVLQRTVVNRFFMTTWKPWLRAATRLYRQHFLSATPAKGAGLIALCRKRS